MKKFMSLLIIFSMLFSMAACATDTSETTAKKKKEKDKPKETTETVIETSEETTEITTTTTTETTLPYEISETKAQMLMNSMTTYTDPNGIFTAQIPEGWTVSVGGFDMILWIRIYDPSNPDLQVFSLLKTEGLLRNKKSKKFYKKYKKYKLYKMFADMIVVTKVEDFYKQFMSFCKFAAKYEATYDGFEYPQISNFKKLESSPYNSYLAKNAIDDVIIHGTFDDEFTGQKGEGMFTGTLCKGFSQDGVGCNIMYNINGITAPYGEFDEYEEVLTKIFGSIQYTDTFVSTVMKDLKIKADAAAQLNKTLQETSNIITEGWYARQKTYDAISAKQSDATLGYERVVDDSTGKVYRAYNGFLDSVGSSSGFSPASDDQYSVKISGYINK